MTLIGGTHVRTSPCFHFLDATWRRYLETFGLRLSLTMFRPGFYPRGGGVVEVHIQPCAGLRGVSLKDRGPVKTATGFSAAAGLPESVAKRQARRATYRLRERGLDVGLREEMWEGGPGSVLAVVLDTAPAPTLFFGLGARGKPSERVADEAVDQVIAYLDAHDAPVDLHRADQIVLPLALAEGPSDYRVAEVKAT